MPSTVIEYGFGAMNLDPIEAYTEENNMRSNRLLEGCGFTRTNLVTKKGHVREDGRFPLQSESDKISREWRQTSLVSIGQIGSEYAFGRLWLPESTQP